MGRQLLERLDRPALVPFALGALILVFVLVQWLIDRRDPKFVEAPAQKTRGFNWLRVSRRRRRVGGCLYPGGRGRQGANKA